MCETDRQTERAFKQRKVQYLNSIVPGDNIKYYAGCTSETETFKKEEQFERRSLSVA